MPVVSAVIPTRGRPELLRRAVASVLAQTMADLEILVVVDGPDPATESCLREFNDARLRCHVLASPMGAPVARNLGFELAQGKWIALLDDDDEWLPEKLQLQMNAVALSEKPNPICAGALIARTPIAEYKWPRIPPSSSEDIADYLMIRDGVFAGERLIQTSTVMAPRALFALHPYKAGLEKHQDWDWLIHALDEPSTEMVFVDEPLAIWNIEEQRPSISAKNNWRASWHWVDSIRHKISPEAYSAFMILYVGSTAARAKSYGQLFPILYSALRSSKPSFRLIIIYLGYWTVPTSYRRLFRSVLSKLKVKSE